ncbi:MAG: hypothetical protein JW776_12310 [Candidatus Lokiarchaeota archaeon]|nr:hypothetical protein [Candidatus Lokiarchaeota archaeon]
MINLQTGKPIDIILPNVYRYNNKQFVDLFFEKGIIRLSSFARFRTYPDEIRGDRHEGRGSVTGESTKEGFQFHVMTQTGNDCYILCGSLVESERLKEIFNCDSCFRIINPLEFSVAISNAIIGFKQSSQGICNYRDYRIITKTIEDLSINDFTNEQGNLIIGGHKMNKRINQLIGSGIELMFLKENKYQDQVEYRFVWSINTQFYPMKEYIDIDCKEAIQFCERIEE